MTHKLLVTLSVAALLIVGAIYLLPGTVEPVESRAAARTLAMEDYAEPLDQAVALGVDGAPLDDLPNARASLMGTAGVEQAAVLEQSVVAGRVVDEQGIPVPGACVVADVNGRWEREAFADAEGLFEVVCPVETSQVVVSVPKFDFYQGAFVRLGSNSSCDFPSLTAARVEIGDLQIRRGAIVVGRLVNEAGDAIPDVTVTIDDRHSGVKTNDLGEFRLSGVASDGSSLQIRPARHHDVFQAVELEVGRVLDMGAITLKELPQFHVHGRVVDEAGVPVPGARVHTWREEVIAGVDGSFEFAPYTKRKAQLRASAQGYRESAWATCDDGAEIELVLRELGPLCRLLFVDAETAQPLPGVSLRKVGEVPKIPRKHRASAEGRLDVRLLNEMDVVGVTASGYLDQDVVPSAEALQGEIQRVEIHRRPSAMLTGTVPAELGVELPCVVEFHTMERLATHLPMEGTRETEWGSPPPSAMGVEGASRLADWLGEAPVLRLKGRHLIRTNAHGQFQFRLSGEQLVRVVCYLDGNKDVGRVAVSKLVCTSHDEPQDVGAMATTELGALTGRVVLPVAALSEEMNLSLEGSGDLSSEITGAGAFEFPGLIPGRYRMVPKITRGGIPRAPFERVVDVQPGTGATLVIDPELGEFGELEITLLLNGAAPAKPFSVTLWADREDGHYGYSDWSPGAALHMVLPVGASYHLELEPYHAKMQHTFFELLDRFEVLPGKNVVHLEVESCHLVCAAPAKYFDPSINEGQLLLWKDSSGNEREPIHAGMNLFGAQMPDKATGTIDIDFPYVPVEAQDLRLEIARQGEGAEPRRIRLPFEAELVMGEVVRVKFE